MTRPTEEFQIPVSYGHIGGKIYGDPKGSPWIAIHGWMDNCDSFKPLFQYFPQHLRLICIDLPGHGYSSNFPHGKRYYIT